MKRKHAVDWCEDLQKKELGETIFYKKNMGDIAYYRKKLIDLKLEIKEFMSIETEEYLVSLTTERFNREIDFYRDIIILLKNKIECGYGKNVYYHSKSIKDFIGRFYAE